jgi:hypothetical protein
VSTRANRWITAAAIAALILGAILSRVIEPGVRVEKAMVIGVIGNWVIANGSLIIGLIIGD